MAGHTATDRAVAAGRFTPEGEAAFRELAAQPEGIFSFGGGPALVSETKKSLSKTIQESRETLGKKFGLKEVGILILLAKQQQTARRAAAAKSKEERRKRQTTETILTTRRARAAPSPTLRPTLSAVASTS